MAETANKKSSRIVSDDDNRRQGNDDDDNNLEDALMEEFNMRLKSCMSQDNLNNKTKEEEENAPHHYEDVDDFLQSEREDHYKQLPTTTCLLNNGLVNVNLTGPQNGDDEDQRERQTIDVDDDCYVDMTTTSSPTTTDNGDELLPSLSPQSQSSVKNRMLLSTDNAEAACLLFTQTVTSPMLTPSEETVDFLKGFATDPSSTPTTGTTDQENFYENAEFLSQKQEVIYENLKSSPPENVYENLKNVGGGGDDVIYENVPKRLSLSVESQSNTDEELAEPIALDEDRASVLQETVKVDDERDDDVTVKPTKTASVMSTSLIKNYEDMMVTSSTNYENLEKDTESVPAKIVSSLKSQFLSTEATNVKKDPLDDVANLKSVDILKQITKFEHDSTQKMVTVETSTTMTYESGSGVVVGGFGHGNGTDTAVDVAGNNKVAVVVKKKKTKKSRKEEKENISVKYGKATNKIINTNNNENSRSEDFFYNVNVKSLCRSFGDLTRIDDNDCLTNRNKFNINNCSKSDLMNNNRMKSSFNKFDALQKKNVLHVRSSDSTKAQEKFNGGQVDTSATATNCRACDKVVFQMEQVKAEKAIWHKNCFRCQECNKQLNVDTYQSHEGTLYCKPHFKALFAPKVVEEDNPPKSRKPELIIRENQPAELPPDVVRASDKPDLGLEELSSLNVKERFQVFEQHRQTSANVEQTSAVNVKRSPSILSKLARFQAKGMDVGIHDDALNGIPIEESSSEGEDGREDDVSGDDDGREEDADLVRARRVQKEKPFHFTGMEDVKNRWEQGEQTTSRDERREERKQEIQSIRNRLFMGKQGKMKEAYQQAVMVSESCANLATLRNKEPIEVTDTKTIKDKFESGQIQHNNNGYDNDDTDEVYESEISKNSRSLFLELDANASKQPQVMTPSPLATTKSMSDVKKAREAYMARAVGGGQDVIKSSVDVDDVEVRTADIQRSFKFFETYKEPEKEKRQFRITPPREGQVKTVSPDREVYRDPEVVRNEDGYVQDSVIAEETHTATKMLNKFRQMEEELANQAVTLPAGPKPLKCFTPPPEPQRARPQTGNTDDESGDSGEYESDDDDEDEDAVDKGKYVDGDLIEAQKAARAKQLRAKFEKWEANEIKREQNDGVNVQANSVNMTEEFGDEQSQIESTRTLRARFESMRETESRTPRQIKVNRFVEIQSTVEMCDSCRSKVYPLEMIKVHGRIYHKQCFKCMECNCVLRMDSYSFNQGLLYCTPHFKRLFISKGNYDTAFGLDRHNKEKWNSLTMA